MSRLAMIRDWKRRMDDYALRLTGAVPEELSEYRAAPTQFTCAELVAHLAECELEMDNDLLRGGAEPVEIPKLILDRSVTNNRKALKLVFQFTDTVIGSLTDSDLDTLIGFPGTDKTVPVELVLRAMIEHQVHHRGQLITYLRLNGVAVPARWSD